MLHGPVVLPASGHLERVPGPKLAEHRDAIQRDVVAGAWRPALDTCAGRLDDDSVDAAGWDVVKDQKADAQ